MSKYLLKLYVTGKTPRAEKAIANLRRICGEDLHGQYELQIIDVTPEVARAAAEAYARWGKSFHDADLNYGDCFSYVTAKANDCPLLYVGNDFARTDVRSALE